MAEGKVDFFNDTGGYGFIETDDEDDDVFFHMEDVGGPDLEEGTEIEFDIEQAPRAPRDERHAQVTDVASGDAERTFYRRPEPVVRSLTSQLLTRDYQRGN